MDNPHVTNPKSLTPFFIGPTHFRTTHLRIWLIVRSGNLYSLCRPENEYDQKVISFCNFFIKKGRNRRAKFDNQKIYKLDYITIHS